MPPSSSRPRSSVTISTKARIIMELTKEPICAVEPPNMASFEPVADGEDTETLPQVGPNPPAPPPSIVEGRCVSDLSNSGTDDGPSNSGTDGGPSTLVPDQKIEPKPSHEEIEALAGQPEIEASASSDPSPTPTPTPSNSTSSFQSGKYPRNLRSQTNVRSWEPFFVRRSTLLAFFVFFTLQLVALITLYVYSSRNNGIVPVAAKYHQAWKYGPNAILAITIALWTQVDLRTKQVTIWSEFLRDVDPPTDFHALETDYLSKINVMALFLSLRRRHWTVAITILGTLLLQLAAIFSTSLLERVTQPISIQTDNLKTSTVLSSQTYDQDVPDFVRENAISFARSILRGADFRYPFGTTKSIAYETLHLPVTDGDDEEYKIPGSKSYITSRVPYIKPSISCEAVFERFDFEIPLHEGLQLLEFQDNGRNMTLSANMSRSHAILNEGAEDSRISMQGNLTINGPTTTLYTLNTDWTWVITPTVPKVAAGDLLHIAANPYARDCGQNHDKTISIPTYEAVLKQSCATDRVVWMVNGMHSNINPLSEATNMTLTLLECAPDEEVGEATMTMENNLNGVSPNILQYGKHEVEVETPYDTAGLLWPISSCLWQAFDKWIWTDCIPNPSNLALECKPSLGTNPLDSAGSKSALEAFYSVIAVQIFRSTLFVPGSRTIPGRIDSEIARLTITTAAFWSVTSVLCVLSLSCVYLILHIGQPRTPQFLLQDPATLGMSIVLLRSHHRPQLIVRALRSVKLLSGSNHPRSVNGGRKWWRPWGTTSSSLWLTITVITALIGLLELTSALSASTTHGLVLANQRTWSYYGWTLVPSFLVAVVGLMVSSIDFNIRVIAPFFRLKEQTPKSANAILNDNIFGIPPFRLWSLIQNGAIGHVMMSLGTMAMPFCLVVTGGLFFLSGKPLNDASISLLQSDGFSEDKLASLNWSTDAPLNAWGPNIGDFPGIEFVPLPAFASDIFAMSSFRLPPSYSSKSLSDKFISLATTVTMGKLNCTHVDSRCTATQRPSFFNVSQSIPCSERSVAIPVQMFERKGCDASLMSSSMVTTYCGDAQIPSISDLDLQEVVNYEHIHHVTLTPWTKTRYWWLQPITNTNVYSTDDDCPSLMTYGEEVLGDCKRARIGFAICDPYLENIEADVMFSLPSFEIVNITRKTSPDGAVWLSDNAPASKVKHHIYGMARYLAVWSRETFKINATKILPLADDSLNPVFLSIMSESESDNPGSDEASTSGVVTLDDLLNAPTDPGARDKIFSAVEYRWAKAMARIIRGYEKPFEQYDPPREVQAKLTDYEIRWLVQDEKSTRILQGILAWAAFCLTTAALIFRRGGRMDRVLCEPPTSIGALYRLLAGSRLMTIPMIFDSVSLNKNEGSNGDGPSGDQSTMGTTSTNQPYFEVDQKQIVSVDRRNRRWWKFFISSNRVQSMDKRELRRLFDVPGRVYRLKEWDVVEEGESSEQPDTARGGNSTDTGMERSNGTERNQPRTRKRYGIDYEDIGEA